MKSIRGYLTTKAFELRASLYRNTLMNTDMNQFLTIRLRQFVVNSCVVAAVGVLWDWSYHCFHLGRLVCIL